MTASTDGPPEGAGLVVPVAEEIWVLLLSDDARFRETLAEALRGERIHVTDARVSADLGVVLESVPCDLAILDTELHADTYPDVLAGILRVLPGHPVILVGRAGEVADRVRGLSAGAVDFVVQPFSVRELAARIRARIRFDRLEPTLMRYGALEVDRWDRSVRHRGIPVHLSNLEFRLLVYLLRNMGHTVTREEILTAVWDTEPSERSNAVDVYVGYLRRKLEHQGCRLPLTTVRGRGYRLEREPATDLRR